MSGRVTPRARPEILVRLDMNAWHHAIEIEKAEIESMNKVPSRCASISGLANK